MAEIMWAITGNHGLYYSADRTRAAAIAEHVYAIHGTKRRWPPLDREQRDAWKECRKNGDRAVKVRVEIIK